MKSVHRMTEKGKEQEALIFAAIEQQPQTTRQLAKLLDIHISRVNRYIERLRRFPRRIHTLTYAVNKGRGTPIHAVGNLPDAVFTPKMAHLRLVVSEQKPEPKPIGPQSWLSALGM